MRRESRDPAYLWDMLMAARDVQEFVQGMRAHEYEANKLVQAAVERKIEVIGEAARNVSREFQASHPEIPWQPIVAQRHVLAHDYGEIKHEKIWRVATLYIPQLVGLLQPILDKIGE